MEKRQQQQHHLEAIGKVQPALHQDFVAVGAFLGCNNRKWCCSITPHVLVLIFCNWFSSKSKSKFKITWKPKAINFEVTEEYYYTNSWVQPRRQNKFVRNQRWVFMKKVEEGGIEKDNEEWRREEVWSDELVRNLGL